MDLNWSLRELYKSFDSEEFKNDFKLLDGKIEEFNSFAMGIDKIKKYIAATLEDYIKINIELSELISKLSSYINLTLAVETSNSQGQKYSDLLNDKLTETVEAQTKINKWIANIKDLDKVVKDSSLLKEHKYLLEEVILNSKYLLSDREEAIISKMKNTGSTAWAKYKDKLISTHAVEFDGKEIPLTELLLKFNEADPKVRKEAYEKEIESYSKIEEGIAAALNGIKGEVITVSDLRGYKSTLEMTLLNSRMKEETLNALLEAIKESLPIFRKYLRRKGELLGHNNGLPFYDLFAPIGKQDMKFTYKEGGDFVVKNFSTFSKELGDYAKRAIDNNWIDVMPKKGKVGGAFCHGLHTLGESRILLNYGDSFGDVVTMAHELGHGYHGECLKDESILNSDYPMPIAETASTFCETIIKKAALKDTTKEEALAILETEIQDATQVIVDIYSRFLFEDRVFKERRNGALSVEEIKTAMIDAQKAAYGDGLDPNYLHPYMWTWKPHYYDVDYNYYNFPYAFGLLFSKGLYAEYQKKGEAFVEDYKKLLSITGKNTLEDVAKSAGIDITKKEFWLSSIEIISEDIEEFMKITNIK